MHRAIAPANCDCGFSGGKQNSRNTRKRDGRGPIVARLPDTDASFRAKFWDRVASQLRRRTGVCKREEKLQRPESPVFPENAFGIHRTAVSIALASREEASTKSLFNRFQFLLPGTVRGYVKGKAISACKVGFAFPWGSKHPLGWAARRSEHSAVFLPIDLEWLFGAFLLRRNRYRGKLEPITRGCRILHFLKPNWFVPKRTRSSRCRLWQKNRQGWQLCKTRLWKMLQGVRRCCITSGPVSLQWRTEAPKTNHRNSLPALKRFCRLTEMFSWGHDRGTGHPPTRGGGCVSMRVRRTGTGIHFLNVLGDDDARPRSLVECWFGSTQINRILAAAALATATISTCHILEKGEPMPLPADIATDPSWWPIPIDRRSQTNGGDPVFASYKQPLSKWMAPGPLRCHAPPSGNSVTMGWWHTPFFVKTHCFHGDLKWTEGASRFREQL